MTAKKLIPFKDCQHKNTDLSWSHGELRRCTDCGAVEDHYGNNDWNNVVETLAIGTIWEHLEDGKLPENIAKSLYHYRQMAKIAEEQYGLGYQDAMWDAMKIKVDEMRGGKQLELPLRSSFYFIANYIPISLQSCLMNDLL